MADRQPQSDYFSAIDSIQDAMENSKYLKPGTRLTLVIEALGDGEQCDQMIAMDYLDFDKEESISGVFRVLRIRAI